MVAGTTYKLRLIMAISDDDPRLDAAGRMRAVVNAGSQVTVPLHSMPFHRVNRSADETYRMANVYYDEHRLEQALQLYLRFVTLHVEHLPRHPDYGHHKDDVDRTSRKKLAAALQRAEKLKPQLKKAYEEEAIKLNEQLDREKSERQAAEAAAGASLAAAAAASSALPSAPSAPPDYAFATANTADIEYPEFDAAEPKNSGLYDLSSGDQLPEGPRPDSGHVAPVPAPRVNRATKPAATPNVHEWDYSASGLRRVIVPYSIVQAFMERAAANTANNIETCGILCAKLQSDAFVISHCVIPKQSGTPDSCTTQDEYEVFSIQDAHNLITTHPTQTAFLSSVDMHTHYAYQVMLSESVAVVCSPKYEQFGMFKLSAAGMRQIGACRETGFHPHDKDPPLFQSCEHSSIEQSYDGEVIDLR